MNADQVIEGIGNVVAAAKPVQEYCFLWIDWWPLCMTKAEWSGWMQALGTFVAILFALALPFMQNKFRRARTYVLAKHALMQLVAIYESLEIATNFGMSTAIALKGCDAHLQSLLAALELVRVDELSLEALPTWWGARANANQLKNLSNVRTDDNALKETLTAYKKVAAACLKDFSRHEPRVFLLRATKVWG